MTVECLAQCLHCSCHDADDGDDGDDGDDDDCYGSYSPRGRPAMWVPARENRHRWNAIVSPSSERGQRKEKKDERERSKRTTLCCLPSQEGRDRSGCQTWWMLL